MLDNWEVDPVGLNGGEGIEIEGYQVNLQVTASLDRGKKRQDKDSVEEMYQLTPHSPRMVHGAPQRFLRLLMVRGALAGSYSRLEGAAAAEMRARVRMPGFTGLDAKECGFENFKRRWLRRASNVQGAALGEGGECGQLVNVPCGRRRDGCFLAGDA